MPHTNDMSRIRPRARARHRPPRARRNSSSSSPPSSARDDAAHDPGSRHVVLAGRVPTLNLDNDLTPPARKRCLSRGTGVSRAVGGDPIGRGAAHRPAGPPVDHRQPGGELSVEVRRPVEGAPGQERPLQIVAAGFDQSLGLPGPAACRPAPLTPGGRGSPGTRSSARTVRRGVGRPRARRPRPAPAAPHPATRVIATASEQVFRPPRRDQHTR